MREVPIVHGPGREQHLSERGEEFCRNDFPPLFWLGIIYYIILRFKISYTMRMELRDSGKSSKAPFITAKQ